MSDPATLQNEAAPSAPERKRPRISIVGIIGELLIFAGLLLALFVVWQLFYTDVQGDRQQAEIVQDLAWAETPEQAVETSTTQTIPDDLKETDIDPPVPSPEYQETFATFMVPRWGEGYVKPISEGVSRPDVLDPLGLGHYPENAMPGEAGNFAIAGHRTTYGKPLRNVDTLHVGDSLIVQTEDIWAVYTVTDWEIVHPSEYDVVAPTPRDVEAGTTGRFITLTTCHPLYSAAERWIVYGELEYWAPTGHGVPAELLEVPQ
ncbi:class E sortase [Demequina sediminicola]|uniref:class E sortase n=1 Tax=Demequina sediminicola TaxID=1095026 RepID=UPI000781B6DA|nr:class E sortase [Demequina sediminicola]